MIFFLLRFLKSLFLSFSIKITSLKKIVDFCCLTLYSSIALFSPRSIRKKHSLAQFGSVCTSRLVKYLSSPLLFVVLLTLNFLYGCDRDWMGSFNHLVYERFMKFSVALESTRATALALLAIEWA